MSRYHCTCGNTFYLPFEKSPYEFFIVGFPLVEELEDLLDDGKLTADDMNTAFVSRCLKAYICDKCKRIIITKGKTLIIYNHEETVVLDNPAVDETFEIPGAPI